MVVMFRAEVYFAKTVAKTVEFCYQISMFYVLCKKHWSIQVGNSLIHFKDRVCMGHIRFWWGCFCFKIRNIIAFLMKQNLTELTSLKIKFIVICLPVPKTLICEWARERLSWPTVAILQRQYVHSKFV